MSRGSSLRRMRLPLSFSVLVIVVAMILRSCLGRGGSHGVDDVLIPGAAAQIAFDAMADLGVRGRRVPLEQLLGRHDHARRAESALESMLIPEGLLDGVQIAVGGQTLDGEDVT